MVVSSEVSGQLTIYPEKSIDPNGQVGVSSIILHIATNSLGVPLFTDELLTIIWSEKRNLFCIHENLRVKHYTVTGSNTKAGVELSVFLCARGSSPLE